MNEELLSKVQNRLYEMSITIVNILDEHNIKYMISFGTLLGAVRHHNFIPWDDDFDIWIFDEDYNKAINTLRKCLPDNLFVEDEESEPLFFHGWARIKDLNTVAECSYFTQDNVYKHKGLTVDLFRIKKMKYCQLNDYIYNEYINYLDRRKNKNLISDDEYYIRIKDANNSRYDVCNKNDKDKIIYGFVTSYKNKYVDESDILPLRKILFRNFYFCCPNNPENILKQLYGNFNELPAIEKRVSHYSNVLFVK